MIIVVEILAILAAVVWIAALGLRAAGVGPRRSRFAPSPVGSRQLQPQPEPAPSALTLAA